MKTILFDLDGTLIDSTEAILESFETSFKYFDLSVPSDNDIKSLIGHPLDIMYEELGVEDKNIKAIIDIYKKHYRLISREKTTLLPYAKKALVEAKKIATLGVVTTKTKRYSLELLEHLEILKYFTIVIGREDVQNPKPHPEPILKAMNFLGSSIDLTWMIGDTPMDLLSAHGAKIKSVGVTCGYGAMDELKKITPNLYETSYEAVRFISKN